MNHSSLIQNCQVIFDLLCPNIGTDLRNSGNSRCRQNRYSGNHRENFYKSKGVLFFKTNN